MSVTHSAAGPSTGPAVDSLGNLKDASDIVFYNSESDEVPLPCPAGPTGEHVT